MNIQTSRRIIYGEQKDIIKADEKITLVLSKKDKGIEYSYVADDKTYSSGIFVL